MDEVNETARILCAEAQDELQQQRDAEIAKILKLRIVLQQLNKVRVKNLDLPDEGEHIKNNLNVLKISEFLRLNNEKEKQPDFLLNLNDGPGELSYMERKALRQQLTNDLRSFLKRVDAVGQKLNAEFPEVFQLKYSGSSSNSLVPERALERIVSLEKERCQKLEKLVQIRNRKCDLLKTVAELKLGPRLGQNLDMLYAQARLNHTKASVLHDYMVCEIMSLSEHAYKALREVEAYVNDVLEESER